MKRLFKKFKHEQIAKLAYHRYEYRGRVNGKDKEDWYVSESYWFLKSLFYVIKKNAGVVISIFTMIILVFQIAISSSNFVSLNRPFIEVKIIGMQPDPEGEGEDASQVWCALVYTIRNYGPIPAYNVRVAKDGLKVRSAHRGEFRETAIPGLTKFKIGWLAPNSETIFPRAIIYTDAKTNVEAYKQGSFPLEVNFKIQYEGPRGLLLRRRYWYQCDVNCIKGAVQIINTAGN